MRTNRTTDLPMSLLRRTTAALGLALVFGAAGCKSNSAQAPNVITTAAANNGVDPSLVNLAPVNGAPVNGAPVSGAAQGQVLGARSEYSGTQTTAEYAQTAPPPQGYPQQTAPANPADYAPNQAAGQPYDDSYENQVDAGQDALYADQPPPPLPVYEQPEADNPNDLWTPGYWDYGNGGYYWVPGAWVAPPYTGALWTPGYWGFLSGRYRFHRGYWGPHIGFYGGIPYGFGYTGIGYSGGYWNGNNFYYNRAVNRVGPGVRNVYEHNVVVRNNYNRVSYNGGRGGISVRPQAAELAAMREQRVPPMRTQMEARQAAGQNRQQFFNENHGRPGMAVAARPYGADHVAAPSGMQRVQEQNQQRLQQMNGQRGQEQNRQQEQQRQQQGNEQRQQQQNQQREQQQRNTQQQEQQRNVQNNQMRHPEEQQRTQQLNQQRNEQNQQQQRQQQQVQQRQQEQNQTREQQQNQQRQQQVQQQQRQQQQVNQQREQQQNQQRQQQQNQQRQQQEQQRQQQGNQQRQQQEQQRQQQQQRQVQQRQPEQPRPQPQAPRPQPAQQPHPQPAAPHPQAPAGGHPGGGERGHR